VRQTLFFNRQEIQMLVGADKANVEIGPAVVVPDDKK